jgi:biotin carboxyl carrier protein
VKNHGNSFQIQIMNELERIRSKFSEQEVMGRYLVAAPMPGVIMKFYVKEGDIVKKNDPLCVLLAMKMENEIRAASDGKVSKIFVDEQAKVEIGEKLMVVDPVGK